MKVKICMGTNCVMNGAMELWNQVDSLNELIEDKPEKYKVDKIELEAIKCDKVCKRDKHYNDSFIIINEEVVTLPNRLLTDYIMKEILK